MSTRIKIRRGLSADWASSNPILSIGEPAYETDTLRLKIGDGTSAYNDLPYSFTIPADLSQEVADRISGDALKEDKSNRGIALGYAPLGADAKIPDAYLPDISISDTYVVNSEAAMLALSAGVGDIAVRTDLNKTYILRLAGASTLSNWQELLSPPITVLSVNAKTGSVSLITDDIPEGSSLYFTTARVLSTVLAGLSIVDSTISASDSILLALGKLQGQVSARELSSNKNASGGYAGLDGSGKIPSSLLPSVAITDTYVVNSEAAMLSLVAERGDVAIRTDLSKSFILASDSPANLSDWKELLSPSDLVLSVNGQTGAVNLTTSNIPEGSGLYFTTARVLSSVLSGIDVNSAGTISSSDTILTAIGKAQKQITERLLRSGDDITGTGGSGYLGLPSQSGSPSTPASGFRFFADSLGRLAWRGVNGFLRVFDGLSNTANRTYTLPDRSGTIALSSDLLGNPDNWRTRLVLFTDCEGVVSSTAGSPFYNQANGGSISNGSSFDTTGDHPGIVIVQGGGTASSYLASNLSNNLRLGKGPLTFEALVTPSVLSNATDRLFIRVGLIGPNGWTPTNGVFFEYSDNLNSGNWRLIGYDNGVAGTPANSSIPVGAGTWARLRIVVNSSGTSAEGFIDGVSIGSINTGIPVTNGRTVNPMAGITKTSGSGTRGLYVDYIGLSMDFNTPR